MLSRFPNDRINNFCDAVFAIAMTLLILEIRIPSGEDIQKYGTLAVLSRLIPNFIGFFISFLVTALYWRAHLTLAQFVKSYDNKLLWLTVWLLLFIVLLPFSTALYSKYGGANGPFVFYCLNLVALGIFNYAMVHYVVKKHGYDHVLTQPIASLLKWRALIPPFIWGLSALWVLVEPLSARMLFVLIFIVQGILEKRYKKKISIDSEAK